MVSLNLNSRLKSVNIVVAGPVMLARAWCRPRRSVCWPPARWAPPWPRPGQPTRSTRYETAHIYTHTGYITGADPVMRARPLCRLRRCFYLRVGRLPVYRYIHRSNMKVTVNRSNRNWLGKVFSSIFLCHVTCPKIKSYKIIICRYLRVCCVDEAAIKWMLQNCKNLQAQFIMKIMRHFYAPTRHLRLQSTWLVQATGLHTFYYPLASWAE